MKKRLHYFLLFTLSLLIFSCKDEEIVTKNGTELEITIQDENKETILDEIDVYLFSNKALYQQSLINEDPQGFDYEIKSNVEGTALFSNIDAKKYYIYINYKGKNYTLNNFFTYTQLEQELTADAATSIIVKLTPFNVGSIAFWTKETNLANLGIDIWVKDSLIGSLPGVSQNQPNDIADSQVLPIFYQTAGNVIWQAKGKNGCYWSGEINLQDKETKFIELNTCSTGKISFWTNPSVIATHQKLTVVVNETEIIGEITSGLSPAPIDCENSSNAQLIIEKPLGSYNYKVLSTNKECVWIGTFDIDKNCSGNIEIVQCD